MKNNIILLLTILVIIIGSKLNSRAQNNVDTFTDNRDLKTYKTVKIAKQVWMAENLAFKPSSGNYWAYNNDETMVPKHGYLYNWETAKNVCPSGWHLPTLAEFEILLSNVGGAGEKAYQSLVFEGNSGFLAHFNGWRYSENGFNGIENSSNYWSVSEYSKVSASLLSILGEFKDANLSFSHKYLGFSVRCLQDN